MYDPRLNDILPRVERPARYTGGEYNSIVKDPASVAVRFAFAFPDVYEIGMSNLGMRILYHVLNGREDTACERMFAPWADMEAELRRDGIPLYALESGDPVRAFDIVGFTLQYEMSYTNILNMLDLAQIPLLAADRGEGEAFVIAGGPCAFNPEPLWAFIDCFCVGDGEEAIGDIVDVVRRGKEQGWSRAQTLRALAGVPGMYVPSLYREKRGEDGGFLGLEPTEPGVPATVEKHLLADLDSAPMPERPIVPYLDITHDRVTLEIFRGCTRGCRFCQAGVLYRPVRERSVQTLVRQATAQLQATGYDEVSLSSLSTGDYSRFAELVQALRQGPCSGHVSLSVPSLRLDAHAKEFMDSLEGGRRTGLTLAPEAGTQRLRDIINKNVTEDDLMTSVRDAFSAGWNKVKLYFMIGLPGETDEDLLGIAELARKVVAEYYKLPKEQRRRGVTVSVSTSNFVPKAHTPFQWHPQDSVEELRRKQLLLKQALKIQGVDYSWHEATLSMLEGAFARGGREMAQVLHRAWQLGCRFDSWREHFKAPLWERAMGECAVTQEHARRALPRDAALPWEHIQSGVDKAFLLCEYDRAMGGALTPDCRESCLGCGLQNVCVGGKI